VDEAELKRPDAWLLAADWRHITSPRAPALSGRGVDAVTGLRGGASLSKESKDI
jgi:hypothetical protein